MASITGGVPFGGFVAPTDTGDVYPVTNPTYGLGGLRNVGSTADRDAIPAQRREQGMMVYVQDEDKFYALQGGTTDAYWTEFSSGGGAVTSVNGQTGDVIVSGVTGATGPAGPTGADSIVPGPTGPTGATGAQGIQGIQGNTGATGPDGAKGEDGAQGPIGPTGPTGANGVTGPVGDYVESFNGATGAVEGVSSVNGMTGDITAASGIRFTFTTNTIPSTGELFLSANVVNVDETSAGGIGMTGAFQHFKDVGGGQIVVTSLDGDRVMYAANVTGVSDISTYWRFIIIGGQDKINTANFIDGEQVSLMLYPYPDSYVKSVNGSTGDVVISAGGTDLSVVWFLGG